VSGDYVTCPYCDKGMYFDYEGGDSIELICEDYDCGMTFIVEVELEPQFFPRKTNRREVTP
jgi:hypothetical protein